MRTLLDAQSTLVSLQRSRPASMSKRRTQGLPAVRGAHLHIGRCFHCHTRMQASSQADTVARWCPHVLYMGISGPAAIKIPEAREMPRCIDEPQSHTLADTAPIMLLAGICAALQRCRHSSTTYIRAIQSLHWSTFNRKRTRARHEITLLRTLAV